MAWRHAVQRGGTRRAAALACVLMLSASTAGAQTSAKGDASRGAAKAAPCASCHGTSDRPPLANTPALAGQQQEFLVLQMFLLREGLRDVPQMTGMLKGVTDRELTDMAAYFASQKPLPGPRGKVDAKRRARGAELAKAMGCGSCHLSDYRGQQQVPRLTHQREDYLVLAMKDYRDNKRSGSDTSMNAVLYQAADSDIQALAHYLAHSAAR
ncbi:MAG: c-type cytochrome [Betaproteobacteria bacterium]